MSRDSRSHRDSGDSRRREYDNRSGEWGHFYVLDNEVRCECNEYTLNIRDVNDDRSGEDGRFYLHSQEDNTCHSCPHTWMNKKSTFILAILFKLDYLRV